MNVQNSTALLCLAVSISFFSCKKEKSSPYDSVPINKIQVVGSHNSYRLRTDDAIFNWVEGIQGALPAGLSADAWDYTHLPLDQQFSDYNIRSIELDIFADPNGGQFSNRFGYSIVNQPTYYGDIIPDLNTSGMKIIHIPDMDFNTNYITFKQALTAVKNWSNAHPNHVPITILIESKEETLLDYITITGATESIDFTPALADDIDEEINDVFGVNSDKIYTPDELRGNFSTLNQAALAGNWKTLGEMRGKIMFVMEGPAVDDYLSGHANLENRNMFVYGDPGSAETAFVLKNGAKNDKDEIMQLVQAGYIVRTRADSDTDEARIGDYSSMNAAFSSGAQIISTDYYRPDYRAGTDPGWTDYHVQLTEGTAARINPLWSNSLKLDGGIGE